MAQNEGRPQAFQQGASAIAQLGGKEPVEHSAPAQTTQHIRLDRDEGFWRGVYEHPEVKPHVSFGYDIDLSDLLGNEWVTPLRAEHGGFFFVRLDGLGRVHELHTLFTPEGWGREVLNALKAAVEHMFQNGAQIITTYDVEGHWRSRPPKTFRFEPAGDFAATELGPRLRSWVLTRNAWEASPARQRMVTCL